MASTSSLYTILNDVWDSTNHALKMVLNYIHTHSSNDEGGQLDWDTCWSDAVHSHASSAEGGQLDWDTCWSDAVHSHASSAEGGTIAHSALTGLTTGDDHTQYLKESLLTTAGDMPYATGAGVWTRLAIGGTVGHILSVASGGAAPEWRAEKVRTSMLLSHTRDMTAASGDVAYTGYGFQPTSLIIMAGGSIEEGPSWGFGDVNLSEKMFFKHLDYTFVSNTSAIVGLWQSYTSVGQTAVLKSLDADGFTLTWTKTGTPSTSTATLIVLALE